jgi:hypothetical protein
MENWLRTGSLKRKERDDTLTHLINVSTNIYFSNKLKIIQILIAFNY